MWLFSVSLLCSMSNQVVQHIETEESRPSRLHLKKSSEEAFRVLKPGGVYVISTRSKEPAYDHLYWYSVLAPKAVKAMSERVPSREECVASLEAAGFEVTQCVCPKYKSIMNPTHYYDPRGVFSEAWRRGESWWSLVSPDELASLQDAVKKMIDNGTADVRAHACRCTFLFVGVGSSGCYGCVGVRECLQRCVGVRVRLLWVRGREGVFVTVGGCKKVFAKVRGRECNVMGAWV